VLLSRCRVRRAAERTGGCIAADDTPNACQFASSTRPRWATTFRIMLPHRPAIVWASPCNTHHQGTLAVARRQCPNHKNDLKRLRKTLQTAYLATPQRLPRHTRDTINAETLHLMATRARNSIQPAQGQSSGRESGVLIDKTIPSDRACQRTTRNTASPLYARTFCPLPHLF